jgi:hypothetical protein
VGLLLPVGIPRGYHAVFCGCRRAEKSGKTESFSNFNFAFNTAEMTLAVVLDSGHSSRK